MGAGAREAVVAGVLLRPGCGSAEMQTCQLNHGWGHTAVDFDRRAEGLAIGTGRAIVMCFGRTESEDTGKRKAIGKNQEWFSSSVATPVPQSMHACGDCGLGQDLFLTLSPPLLSRTHAAEFSSLLRLGLA